MLTISVFGRPAPQGSKNKGPHGQMREASRFLPAWRQRVKLAAMRARKESGHKTIDGPVAIGIVFLLARPDNPLDPDFPIGPPDWDKLSRAVCDALTDAGVYADDSRVVQASVSKAWTPGQDSQGAVITVQDMRKAID